MHRSILLLLFISYFHIGFAQSTGNAFDFLAKYKYFQPTYHKLHRLTFGANYDITNSAYGFVMSNGWDEQPIVHFEDMGGGALYKIQGLSDFKKGYSFDLNLSSNYLLGPVYIANAEYFQRNLTSPGLFQRDVNLSTEFGLRFIKSILFIKVGHQDLNNSSKFGTGLGLQRSFHKIYGGFMVTDYFGYFNYSVYLQKFVVRRNISLRAVYDRINKYDFLNLGVHYTFTHYTVFVPGK